MDQQVSNHIQVHHIITDIVLMEIMEDIVVLTIVEAIVVDLDSVLDRSIHHLNLESVQNIIIGNE